MGRGGSAPVDRPLPLRALCVTALLLFALLALAAPAGAAAPSHKKAIWGPVAVDGVSQFPIYHRLGVGIFLYRVNWSAVAPTRPAHPADPADPAYQWPAELDQAIAQARRYRMHVAIALDNAPSWASGHPSSDPVWAPRHPADFATFAAAASRRYPFVRLWQIWQEPTQTANFQPLIHERRDRPLGRAMRRGPHIYARILDASYGALKRVHRSNLVIGGNTFTTGDVSVLNWIKNLRLPNGKPPRMDMYGHNPFSARRPVFGGPPLGHGFIDFTDLPILARWIDRYLSGPRHRPHMKIFISELFWPTDHPNFEFNFWVTRRTAASWLTDALRITRRWSRIYTLGYIGLYDDPPRPDGLEVDRGLLTLDGKKKPAYYAYQRG